MVKKTKGAKHHHKRTRNARKKRKGTRHVAKKHKRTRHSPPKGGLRKDQLPKQGKQSIELTLVETEAERNARFARNLTTAMRQVQEGEAARAALAVHNPVEGIARDIALLNVGDIQSDVVMSNRTGNQSSMVRTLETFGALMRSREELNTRLVRHLNTMRNHHDRETYLQAARDIAPIAHVVLTAGVGPLPDHDQQQSTNLREIHDAFQAIAAHQGVVQDRSTNRWRMSRADEDIPPAESDPFLAAATVAAMLHETPRTNAFEGLRLVDSPTDTEHDAPEDIVTVAARRQGPPPPPGPGSGSTFTFEAPGVPPDGFDF